MENNKNSNLMSSTRYNFGVTNLMHKDKYVTTSVGSSYDAFVANMANKQARPGIVPSFTDQRPDLISNIFYDSPGYWWYVMQYNGISDPFEELKSGSNISIPEL